VKREHFVLVMLVVSVSLNVILAHKLNEVRPATSTAAEPPLQSGATVPSFDAIDLNGQARRVSYSEVPQPTVLYIFTPSCSWCARNLDNLRELTSKKTPEYRFIGVSLSKDGLDEYVKAQGLKMPVLHGISDETRKKYRLGATPQTIVVSPNGQVMKDWVGAFAGPQKTEIESYFHVTLPGIRSAS
jgi:peroxiredoxin